MRVDPGRGDFRRHGLMITATLAGLAALGAPSAQARPAPCALAAPPPANLDLPRKYAPGLSQSQINPDVAEVYARGRDPLVAVRARLNTLTEQILSARAAPATRRAAARCLMSNLDGFAQAGSLLGRMSPQAKDLRMFFLPTAAIAFVIARGAHGDPAREARIEAWLADMAADSIKREDKRAAIGNSPAHPHQINNHYYWTGYGALLVGIATRDGDLHGWGARAIERGLDEVDPEGFLAPEIARDSRALSYHALALQPLAMGVMLMRQTSRAPSPPRMDALERLGERTAQGVVDPAGFAQRMASRNGGRVIDQTEVPRTPPAIPLLMSLFGPSLSLSAVDARVRCYPNGAIGPSVGVWTGPASASKDFAWPRPGAGNVRPRAFPPTGYKVCVR